MTFYICVSSRTEHGTGTFYTAETCSEAVRKVDELIASGVNPAEVIILGTADYLTFDVDGIRQLAADSCD